MTSFPLVPFQPERPPATRELLRTHRERLARLLPLEAEVTAFEAELAWFRAQFAARCGRLASELADLELEIARLLHERRPDDPILLARLREAEVTAGKRHQLEDAQEDAGGRLPTGAVRRTAEAQALFHAIARRVHPDLGADPAEVALRHEAMVHLNWLYARGDVAGLHEMLQDCIRSEGAQADATFETDLPGYLAHTIAAMNRRMKLLEARLVELRSSDDAVLREEMLGGGPGGAPYAGPPDEEDPFDRLGRELRRRIGFTAQRFDQLRRPGGPR